MTDIAALKELLARYAHGNGSSHAIARAAITAFLAAQRREM